MKNLKITSSTVFLFGMLIGIVLVVLLSFCANNYAKFGKTSIFRSYSPSFYQKISPVEAISLGSSNFSTKFDADPLPW